MKRIAIGEEREYAKRLSDYLNHHMSGYVHIYSITMPDQMLQHEEADLYLLGESFHKKLRDKGWKVAQEKVLLITDGPGKGSLCKWQSPKEWIGSIERKLYDKEKGSNPHKNAPSLIALYCPDSNGDIRAYAENMMDVGSLYLGLEDVGECREDRPTMAELGYYIHLHEDSILSILQEIAVEENGKYYVDSCGGFYDLIGITEEDYGWFFERLREEYLCSDIYVALGNAAISSINYFKMFDQVYILETGASHRYHPFCQRLMETIMQEDHFAKENLQLRFLDDLQEKESAMVI